MRKKINTSIIVILIVLVLALIGRGIYYKIKSSYSIEIVDEEKYFLLLSNNKVGIIDVSGKVIIEPQFYDVHIPNPSKPIFVCYYDYNSDTNYKTKVINAQGTEIFTKYPNLETISLSNVATTMVYEKNLLKFKDEDKYGLINLDGKLVVSAEYESIEGLSCKEGELLAKKDGKYGVINNKGAEIIQFEYDYISGDEYYTKENGYKFSGYVIGDKTEDGNRYGYITYRGKLLYKPEYSEIIRLGEIGSENTDEDIFLILRKNGQCGLVKNKKTILEFKYQDIDYSGSNNLFIVNRNGKSGICNSKGEKILPTRYEQIETKDSYIYTKTGKEEAYFNLNGNRIDKSTIEEKKEEENTSESNENLNISGLKKDKKDGKYGFINENLEIVIDYIYDDVTEFNKKGFAGIKIEQKWGSIDKEGNIIQEPIYKIEDEDEVEFIGKYYKTRYNNIIYYTDGMSN